MHQPQPDDQIQVSVIVPAFNMELYIEQCLRSLFEQTIEPLEAVVVDDGSTDRTCDVVKSLSPPAGKSLRLISKPNGGLSSARNAGLNAARGRWIGFVDADDWVASTMFSRLVSEAESAGAQVAIARNVRVDAVSGEQEPSRDFSMWNDFIASHGRHINPRNSPDLFLLDHSPCKRAYKRAFLQEIGFAFKEGLVFEDFISSYQILCKSNRVIMVDEAPYFYRVGRPGQIIGRKDESILDVFPAFSIIMDELRSSSASPDLWANFIYNQGWLIQWLTVQIMDGYREKLVSGAANMALGFPPQGIRRFREKFQYDSRVTTAVELQLYGNSDLYADFALTGVASERAKKVVRSDALQRFFIARSQVTSRLANISSRRRRRKTRTSPLATGHATSAVEIMSRP
jgi:glycosyltransferase involved in cell wall biosynthesis